MLSFPNIDPVIISFGPLAISWYSLSYVVGTLLGWCYILKIISINKHINVTKQHVDDFISWFIISIIVGGRLGYVFFYDPKKYLLSPIEILKTYEGGMSFHGAMIGCIVSSWIFTKKYKVNFLTFSDLLSIAAPIGLFLGRIANFINGELYGRVTNVSWAFIFPRSDYKPRHPSQLYEAILEGLVLFAIMYIITFRWNFLLRHGNARRSALTKTGLASGCFLMFYGLFRIIVEFFREPDIQIGILFEMFSMGQILSLPLFTLGMFLIFYSNR